MCLYPCHACDRSNRTSRTLHHGFLHQTLGSAMRVVDPIAPLRCPSLTIASFNYVATPQATNASLWSIDAPRSYVLEATLVDDSTGLVVDAVNTSFGIRRVTFDADGGMFLNNQHVELRGVVRCYPGFTLP
jgi:hypothetical protein